MTAVGAHHLIELCVGSFWTAEARWNVLDGVCRPCLWALSRLRAGEGHHMRRMYLWGCQRITACNSKRKMIPVLCVFGPYTSALAPRHDRSVG